MVLQYAVEHESENRARIASRLEREDVPFTMLDAVGSPGGELRNVAELADLIVVTSRPGEHDPLDARHTVGDVATKSGLPILAVPPACKGINLAGPALIAWNGSHQSSDALKAALPMLKKSGSVTLLDLNPTDGDFEGAEAARYLSRNGIHAEVIARQTDDETSDAILAKAADMDAHTS